MDQSELKGIIEAILFTAGKTVRREEILPIFDGRVSPEEFDGAITDIRQGYDKTQGGFYLEEVAHGYRLISSARFGAWLKRFYRDKHKRRLSSAALETLAIIAYKQPVIRIEIESIRGVNCEGVLHSLLEVGLVRIMGHKQVAGRPILYGSTNRFLELFGLKNLTDLPPLDELEEMLKEKEKKLEEEQEKQREEKQEEKQEEKEQEKDEVASEEQGETSEPKEDTERDRQD